MTEADEVAESMQRNGRLLFWNFDAAARYVRAKMPDETEQVKDNVAWALWEDVQRRQYEPSDLPHAAGYREVLARYKAYGWGINQSYLAWLSLHLNLPVADLEQRQIDGERF